MKDELKTLKLEAQQQANQWRTIADSLYARAIYKNFIQQFGLDLSPLGEIAEELTVFKIPRIRDSGHTWTGKDVSRLLARVAALADDTDSPAMWAHKIDGFEHDLGLG